MDSMISQSEIKSNMTNDGIIKQQGKSESSEVTYCIFFIINSHTIYNCNTEFVNQLRIFVFSDDTNNLVAVEPLSDKNKNNDLVEEKSDGLPNIGKTEKIVF